MNGSGLKEIEKYKTKLRDVEMELSGFEFIVAILFAACITLIFSIASILHISFYWSAIMPYAVLFFSISISIIFIILPVIKISQKVGLDIKDIWIEYTKEFKNSTKLGKVRKIIGIIATLLLVINLVKFIVAIL